MRRLALLVAWGLVPGLTWWAMDAALRREALGIVAGLVAVLVGMVVLRITEGGVNG